MINFDDHSESFGGMVRTDRTIAIELNLIQTLHSMDLDGIVWYFLSCLVARLPLYWDPPLYRDVIIQYNILAHGNRFLYILTFWEDVFCRLEL